MGLRRLTQQFTSDVPFVSVSVRFFVARVVSAVSKSIQGVRISKPQTPEACAHQMIAFVLALAAVADVGSDNRGRLHSPM